MAKKRKDNSTEKKPTTPISWGKIIIVIVLVIIILLLIFLYKTPKVQKNVCGNGFCEQDENYTTCLKDCPRPTPTQCELNNLTCYSSCPSNYAQVDFACNSGKVCCKKIEQPNKTICEKQGYTCFGSSVPEPKCPSGYLNVNLPCYAGQVCCNQTNCTGANEGRNPTSPECCSNLKEVSGQLPYSKIFAGIFWCVNCGNGICDQHENWYNCQEDCPGLYIFGLVNLKQGNCMPPIDPKKCNESYIATQVVLFPVINQSEMNGNYYQTIAGPISIGISNITNRTLGYYEFLVYSSQYSIFAKDPITGEYYCNSFTNGKACLVDLSNNKSQQFDILIDHSTQ